MPGRSGGGLRSRHVRPLRPPRPATGVGFRLGVFDTSVLTTDVTAAVFRGRPSSILDGMRYGTLRGFIPHYVWAEVHRVLADLKREGGAFDLAAAERLAAVRAAAARRRREWAAHDGSR